MQNKLDNLLSSSMLAYGSGQNDREKVLKMENGLQGLYEHFKQIGNAYSVD